MFVDFTLSDFPSLPITSLLDHTYSEFEFGDTNDLDMYLQSIAHILFDWYDPSFTTNWSNALATMLFQ